MISALVVFKKVYICEVCSFREFLYLKMTSLEKKLENPVWALLKGDA